MSAISTCKTYVEDKLDSFLRLVWPDRYSETFACDECRFVVSKMRMVRTIDGRFCSEDCADRFWWHRQGGPAPNEGNP